MRALLEMYEYGVSGKSSDFFNDNNDKIVQVTIN
jgi:hypothetical protein